MKLIKAIILIILLTSVALAQGYKIKKDVISSCGGQALSGEYKLISAAGQPTVGKSSSGVYCLESGFLVGSGCQFEQIPTLSEWGMIIMGLLLLAAGTAAIVRRRTVVMQS